MSVVIGALVIARAIGQHTGLAAVKYRASPAKLRPEACRAGQLNRSYVIQEMRLLAVTWANDTRGKLLFWLHTAVLRGHLAVR